ncbi:MAG: hypothetical protein OXD01_16100 [Gammaproteobacteria bacterium]|nr:hypothetical protein [Gammaproteobacteria bacterium]
MGSTIEHIPRPLSFSQRHGYEPLPVPMRLEHLSEDLRRELRDATQELVEGFSRNPIYEDDFESTSAKFWKSALGEFLCQAQSEITSSCSEISKICDAILSSDSFNKVMDFLEVILRHLALDYASEEFASRLKMLFKKHQAAYWLNTTREPYQFFPSTTEEQANAVENNIETIFQNGHDAATAHLRQAVEHMNALQYADSILDSIHAVESVARKIDPKSNLTLGTALDSLKKAGLLQHSALIKGFKSLYGYTSDEGGIRHSLVDHSSAKVGQEEAIFMFGACASFASYLSEKHSKISDP